MFLLEIFPTYFQIVLLKTVNYLVKMFSSQFWKEVIEYRSKLVANFEGNWYPKRFHLKKSFRSSVWILFSNLEMDSPVAEGRLAQEPSSCPRL
jgi:hypothetical protein